MIHTETCVPSRTTALSFFFSSSHYIILPLLLPPFSMSDKPSIVFTKARKTMQPECEAWELSLYGKFLGKVERSLPGEAARTRKTGAQESGEMRAEQIGRRHCVKLYITSTNSTIIHPPRLDRHVLLSLPRRLRMSSVPSDCIVRAHIRQPSPTRVTIHTGVVVVVAYFRLLHHPNATHIARAAVSVVAACIVCLYIYIYIWECLCMRAFDTQRR